MKSFIKTVSVVCFIALFYSCTSTLLTSSWTKEGYTAQTYKKILVFAIASKTSSRASVENAMVAEFRKQGYNASSSLSVFPDSPNMPAPDQMIPKEQLAQKLKDNHVDGLLVLSLLDVKKEEVYVQGQTYTEPQTVYHPNGYYNRYNGYYGDYYGYYSTVYNTVTEPGYYEEQTTYYLESNFYNVAQAGLVWSGQSEAVDPANLGKGSKDWATEVVGGLTYDKVIVK